LERSALNALREYDAGAGSMEAALQAVRDYWILINSELAKTNPAKANKEVESITDRIAPTLSRQPWKKCGCKICESIGIEVVIFRGNNRNRRRGVHNLHVYGQRLRELKGL